MTNMFPFITDTWNPLKGECPHNCYQHQDGKPGCWAKKLIAKRPTLQQKYHGAYNFDLKQIEKKFKEGSFVFVCDMLDLFAINVPMTGIMTILKQIRKQPNATFLLLTKNPRHMWLYDLPVNTVVGATIESDINYPVSKAPAQLDRLQAMRQIDHPRKFISIEPIMDFDLAKFSAEIILVKPEFVAVGYDNYKNGLTEPAYAKTIELINVLEKAGIKVYRKTLREPLIASNGKTGETKCKK